MAELKFKDGLYAMMPPETNNNSIASDAHSFNKEKLCLEGLFASLPPESVIDDPVPEDENEPDNN
jgi:hypothetical protein